VKVALIQCPDCSKDVSDIAPSCPNCGRPISAQGSRQVSAAQEVKKTSPLATGCLVVALAVFGLWIVGNFFRGDNSSPALTGTPVPTGPQLELVEYTWHIEYGYAILEGQVTNISSQALRNVAAVASYYDTNGGFITSSDTLTDYNPILPGQTSPFKVMTRENPMMRKARVEFKELMGGTIPFRQAESKKGTKK
jgi:hypothetical protein